MIYNNKPLDYFDNKPAKEFLESKIYREMGKRITSNVLQVTGPALERHVDSAKEIASNDQCKIYCIEIEHRVFNEMVRRLKNINIDHSRLKIAKGNVMEYERVFGLSRPCRFEDIDLCQSLITSKYQIACRLHTQSRWWPGKYTKLRKGFVFTASLRPNGIEGFMKNVNTILNVIGARLSVKATLLRKCANIGHSVKKWNPVLLQTGDRLIDLKLYSYKDTNPMISCAILYK